jgi:hypothetical protein
MSCTLKKKRASCEALEGDTGIGRDYLLTTLQLVGTVRT